MTVPPSDEDALRHLYAKVGQNTQQLNMMMSVMSDHHKKQETMSEKFQINLRAHIEDEMGSLNEHREEIRKLHEKIDKMVIPDHPEQHNWIAQQILIEAERHEIKKEVWKKVLTGGVWAGLIALGSVILYAIEHYLGKQ